MPKMKTKRGVRKRMSLTKSGKVKRRKAFHGHLLSGKSAKRRRNLRQPAIVTGAFAKNMKRMMGEA